MFVVVFILMINDYNYTIKMLNDDSESTKKIEILFVKLCKSTFV